MKNVFHVGGPIVVTNQSSEFTAIRTVSKTARDGRVQVGKDWFTPSVPDKYGRIARMLTDSEREEWELEKRMEAALRALSCLPVTESLATSVEKLLNVELQLLSKPSAKACQVTPADATAQQENTLIHYLYRDGSNYKRGSRSLSPVLSQKSSASRFWTRWMTGTCSFRNRLGFRATVLTSMSGAKTIPVIASCTQKILNS